MAFRMPVRIVFLALLGAVAASAQTQVVEWVAIVHDPPGTTTARITREFEITQGQPTVSRKVTGAIGTGRFVFVDAVKMSPTLWCLSPEPGAYLASLAVEIRGDTYTFQPGWINPGSAGQPQPVLGCGSSIDIGPSRIESTRLSALLMVWQ